MTRWTNGQKEPHPRTQMILTELHYVVMCLNGYYPPKEIREWLYARHDQLRGQRAIDLIHEAKSEEVLNILNRADVDAYL